jgi:hypothetical protein
MLVYQELEILNPIYLLLFPLKIRLFQQVLNYFQEKDRLFPLYEETLFASQGWRDFHFSFYPIYNLKMVGQYMV